MDGERVRIVIAGPDQHVPVVERMIRTIKERVRLMTKLLIIWCVIFCVGSMNLQSSSTSTDSCSPHEQFSGMKLGAKRDLRCGFGDYIQATVPITDNSMLPRT